MASLLKDILKQDISITITDSSTVLYYSPSETLELHSKVGDKLNNEASSMKTLQDGKSMECRERLFYSCRRSLQLFLRRYK